MLGGVRQEARATSQGAGEQGRIVPANIDAAVDCLTALWQRGRPTVVATPDTWPPVALETSVTIISTERLDRVVSVDRDNSTLVVESGAPIDVVREAAGSVGLWCPALRWLRGSARIGVAVAGGHGRRSRTYGTVADYLLGTRFACPVGGIVRHGGKAIKNASGYNLSATVAGSRGELGVILEVTLRLVPAPAFRAIRRFQITSIESAFECARFLSDHRLEAAAVEVEGQLSAGGARMLVEVEDAFLGNVERRLDRLTERAVALGARIDEAAGWPTMPTAGERTRRLSIDPKRLADVVQEVVAGCRERAIEGSLLAEATSGAVELSLLARSSETVAIISNILPRASNQSDQQVLRALLRSAFDPDGLLRSG